MRKAIVVGASSGIGKEVAILLAEKGYKVGITARRKDLLDKLSDANKNFVARAFDCTKVNNNEELNALTSALGGVDIVFISAGIGHLNRSLDYALEDETNQLNVVAFTEIAGWAYNYFKTEGTGQLVAITSLAGLRGGRAAPAYNASKAYQISYLEALRQRITKDKSNITITDIRAGFIDTGMAKGKGLFWVAPLPKAAQLIVKGILSKRTVLYVTKRWRIIAILFKILPRFVYDNM